MKTPKLYSQSGSALVTLIIVMPFLMLITALYMELTVGSLGLAGRDQLRTHAQFSTDAGIDFALQEINIDNAWIGTDIDSNGTIDEAELHNDGEVRTTYQVYVTAVDDDNKLVTSVGRSYKPATSTTPSATVTVNVDLRAVRSGEYSVASGVGGLLMQNSAKIIGGNVLINGGIHMQNSAQIGLSTSPVNVEVAHQNCPQPPDASYPALCASGENGEPILIENQAHIYGTVKANNQTNGQGMDDPGLVASSGVSAQPLPPHDRTAQKNNITLTSSDNYYLSCDSNTATRTWPARLKIVGDVSIKKGCVVTLEGDVWITGRLTIENSASIRTVDGIALGGQNTVNASLPTIMVDGSAGVVAQNSARLQSNADNVGMQVITYWSRASCSPDCSDVTGVDLNSSRNDRTILLQNSAEAPNALLYARWTQIELSNGGSIGAVVGQTVRLTNSATITFGASAGAGNTYWVIDGYRRAF